MKRVVRMFATLLLVLTLFTAITPAASAKSMKTMQISSSYNKYVTCQLVNKRKDGYVNISVANYNLVYGRTQRNTVCMRTTRGAKIWEEKGAIACAGNRTFRLGHDHSAYRIYVKTYYGKGGVTFRNAGNVNIV